MAEIPFLPSHVHLPGANIKVVGVGGAGCNAINRMIESVSACLDLGRLRSSTMSEYLIAPLG